MTAFQIIDWESVEAWFDRTIDKIRIGRSFRALFTKNRQASAVVVSENRININPSIKSSPNVQPLFTSSGGSWECPDCDNQFIFSYAIISGANKAAKDEFNSLIAIATGKRSPQDALPPSDIFSIGSTLSFGDGIPTHPKGGKGNVNIAYEFQQEFIVDEMGGKVMSGINKIFVEKDSKFNNITNFERLRHDTNNLGGARPEGTIRFYNSAGRINVNLNFPTERGALRFWDFYFTQVYNNSLKSLLQKYDKDNGTNYSDKY